MKCFSLICYLSLLLQLGCASTNPRFVSPDSIPHSEEEQLIEAAVRRAVVEQKDIPGYNELQNKRRIVLQNVRGSFFQWSSEPIVSLDSIPVAYAPQYRGVEIVLASPAEINRMANDSGDFLHLVLGEIEVTGDSARIELGLEWAQSKESRQKMIYLGGGGYRLVYRKQNGTWVFSRKKGGWQY